MNTLGHEDMTPADTAALLMWLAALVRTINQNILLPSGRTITTDNLADLIDTLFVLEADRGDQG
jgi:hypothetical protein